ncbi:hypothetical protein BN946_scf184851.g12 [Trametes cinnabarina]|uniref:Uncharacterized protein n=1 Tax=Pycnoporus cinnabarinus TaxID=5643 RepID=A0A060SBF5_PYCCI|nr:hypothetical protein BN946_scf184851.g12 [Trametes cinnabarina]
MNWFYHCQALPAAILDVISGYTVPPQRDPEAGKTWASFCDAPNLDDLSDREGTNLPVHKTISWLSRHVQPESTEPEDPDGADEDEADSEAPLGPFDNVSQFRIFDWHYNASLTKSKDDFDDLLDVLRSDGFSVEDLNGFSAQAGQQKLDEYAPAQGIFSAADGWFNTSVEVPLPKPRQRFDSEEAAPHFTVSGVHHRRLTDLIRAAAEDSRLAEQYHWIPHMYFWQPNTPVPARAGSPDEIPPANASPSPAPSSPPPANADDAPPPLPEDVNERIRIFTDIYNSDAALHEFEAIRNRPRNPEDAPDVEYVMAPLMFWSDATHLTSFGSASLWPIYMYFGALLKYVRGMPTEFAAHHVAYIPSLPDELQDYYMHVYGTTISADILTFCKRELMQKIWLLLLDDEFLNAYENGILVHCGDGVTRRIFPRILTYSADYPEKILLTALKPLSKHPCPRCLVSKDHICLAGTPDDMHDRREKQREDTPALRRVIKRARKLLFQGASLGSKRIQNLLDSRSLNPIQSAFSTRLARFGLNHYHLFAPDLMHEFELGVWKGTFMHLLRLLVAQGGTAVQEFNGRMRQMPTFRRDTIRKFWHDVSARKQLAARDYEDFLACVMPAFEGLLPLEDGQNIADLLFELANWHALAKLRLHTSVTIDIFRAATEHMCRAVRRFARMTCKRYEAHELPRETEARMRREEIGQKTAPVRTPKLVRFNVLNTYKYHSLPDYPDYVEYGGTTDNYNSQVAELEHRHAKRYYRRTNKIGYALQIARHQRRATLLRALRELDDYIPRRERIRQKRAAIKQPSGPAHNASAHTRGQAVDSGNDEEDDAAKNASAPTHPIERYAISQTRRVPLRLSKWLVDHKHDPATKNFIPMLRSHLFGRLMDRQDHDDFTLAELDRVHIDADRIYRHKVLRINYTTYDIRRNQDVVNPRTHPDVMVLADDDEHIDQPYWHARVLDIFHAYIRYDGPGATRESRKWRRIDFLWVRWFERDIDYPSGFLERRLPRLRFSNASDPDASPFGFLDPSEVIRAAYLMPVFAHGTTSELLGPSKLARRASSLLDADYEYYYVGIFADRDMFMRHLGGGVGHAGIGVSLMQSREHAHRRECTVTPDPLSEDEDASNNGREDVVDFAAEGFAEEDPEADGEALGAEGADDGWQFDVGLGGFAEENSESDQDDARDPGWHEVGYYDEDGEPVDPYGMEGFAAL